MADDDNRSFNEIAMKSFQKMIAGTSLFLLFVLALPAEVLPLGQDLPHNSKSLTISAIENEHTHELAKDILRAAYARIGFDVTFEELPARRALEWANDGKTDGDVARIDGTSTIFPNLIKIKIPVIEIQGVAFTKNITRDIRAWSDLQGLSIGVIGGIRYSDIGTSGMNPVSAQNMTHLFKLLAKDHIDIAIAVLDAGRIEIHRNFPASGIHPIGQPLHSSPLFHFIHKKNRTLAAELEAALQEMHSSGEMARIRLKSLNALLTQ